MDSKSTLGSFGKNISGVVAPPHRADCRSVWRAATPVLAVVGFGVGYLAAAYRSAEDHADMPFLEFAPGKGMSGGLGALVGMAAPTVLAGAQHVYRCLEDYVVRRCATETPSDRIVRQAVSASPLTLEGLLVQVKRLEQVHTDDPAGLTKALAALGTAISFDEEGPCACGHSLDQFSFLVNKMRLLAEKPDNGSSASDFRRDLLALASNLGRTLPLEEEDAREMVTCLVNAADRIKRGEGDEEHQRNLAQFAETLFRQKPFKHIDASVYRREVRLKGSGLRDRDPKPAMRAPADGDDGKHSQPGAALGAQDFARPGAPKKVGEGLGGWEGGVEEVVEGDAPELVRVTIHPPKAEGE